ncbi:pseudaminic acid biosynthesis N-acetyl transferase [Schinkia azotoformans MEV2011]|uniref:Pseudaminic acid biosynthesis N-acetyl transferase n=1 Tax=Schinkia azotoformans MEV2011 TaxID=1348973 RepID=A0A072NL16_SCHAZ|nr:UDP-4-amino-4,6-dideoxy-N-acetyl-beta-L-altrosamine N-acetyltransferase [Schinkia azotoformans]KEF38384.1 pseudaminic acid biosynthesis N-acetyl transferase [Schinkia azotoformans MEV2011]MEC1694127.1 UDP-4-amino-4,6-dideoxy-N-acetyl-beta-L-altrosamine N-acetyltransferase [Schinkia azotoformans]MEC1715839.1 UDP-4-amino-4,6-dideoxy-N-acetyl-beta-L-altrosamine N-acetyltransferase [Schinkia azotoformans]MEC1724868.1 UDP-4-amino-4,6-dideoxy-N-acetyl-beta-L-altrosamine N-acetyltransferase [Schink
MVYDLRAPSEKDRNLLHNWRNAEFIRINMFDDQPITFEAHCNWFETILKEQLAYYRIIQYQSKPLGLVSFKKNLQQKNILFWGFYIGETQAPKGAGTWMGRLALEYAFQILEAEKIIGEVLSFNKKSMKFHEKLGFKQNHQYQNTLFREGHPIPIVRYELDKEDWLYHRKDGLN